MTAQMAVKLTLLISLWLVVFSLGARTKPADTLYLARRPALLLRAVLAIFVAAPAIAILLSSIFTLDPAIKFALVALAVAPVPPILAFKQEKVGTKGDYAVGLLISVAVISLVATPLLVEVASRLLGVEAGVGFKNVATTLVMTVAIPLGAGILLQFLSPKIASAVHRVAFLAGMILLVGAFGVVVFNSWPQIVRLVGNGSVLVITLMIVLSIALGHFLGSYPEDDRGALALATTTRHPGVALAIATASFPDQHEEALAGVLLFLLVSAVVTGIYVRWMGKVILKKSPRGGSANA